MVIKEYEPFIENAIKQLCEASCFPQTTKYKQQGRISIYEHSIAVAYASYWIVCVADKFCAMKEALRMNDILLKNYIGAYRYDFK